MSDQDPIDLIAEKWVQYLVEGGKMSPVTIRILVAEARASEESKLPEIRRLAANEALEKVNFKVEQMQHFIHEAGHFIGCESRGNKPCNCGYDDVKDVWPLLPAPAEKPEPPAKEKQMSEGQNLVESWQNISPQVRTYRDLITAIDSLLAAQRKACGIAGAAWVAKNTNHSQSGVEEIRQAIFDARVEP